MSSCMNGKPLHPYDGPIQRKWNSFSVRHYKLTLTRTKVKPQQKELYRRIAGTALFPVQLKMI